MPPTVHARGPRISLTSFDEGDFAEVHAIGSDSRVVEFMAWGPNSVADTREFLDRAHRPDDAKLTAAVRLNERLIGTADIDVSAGDGAAEIGYAFAAGVWGRGYASEAAALLIDLAFDHFDVNRVWATCDPANVASARVLEKAGMRYEGLIRDLLEIRGRLRDSLRFGITRVMRASSHRRT